jgi:hypothetical protein
MPNPPVRRALASFTLVPRLWFWTQAAIIVFVVAGMVIAITKLA